MTIVSKISSGGSKRRLPSPALGIDVNFCRNPQCELFMEPPNPEDTRAQTEEKVKPNFPRGSVINSRARRPANAAPAAKLPFSRTSARLCRNTAELQLPHRGTLIRQDIVQMAHAFMIRHFLGKTDERFVFVLDADSGLALPFVSAFSPWVARGQADVVVVQFDKHQFNDQRNMLVLDGQENLELVTGIDRRTWKTLPAEEAFTRTDDAVELMLRNHPLGAPFAWPFHTKSEPHRNIRILT